MPSDDHKPPQTPQHTSCQGEVAPSDRESHRTRTSGSDAQSCRLCGAAITGRRRNGFCSDRCRMRVKRQADDKRMDTVLAAGEAWFATLRAELRRRS